ncbi:hypothetical protein AXX17_AT4G17950 [Arabidopsis thaliana]|uniref:Uncharacterized protein n=1 Tax=Arabidopsis thaliana TaxID=3702 RepID=A0A178UZD7_ARATH|nr:hypothetical protein AXX17_AT4G17950 [Arabidopsis thaliana]
MQMRLSDLLEVIHQQPPEPPVPPDPLGSTASTHLPTGFHCEPLHLPSLSISLAHRSGMQICYLGYKPCYDLSLGVCVSYGLPSHLTVAWDGPSTSPPSTLKFSCLTVISLAKRIGAYKTFEDTLLDDAAPFMSL